MRLLVTLGTDGNTDWVRTPDGQKFSLGSVSVLSFVTRLALGGKSQARRALDDFLHGKEVMVRVDDDMMWEMLAPRRSRWAAADSFMAQLAETSAERGNGTMTIAKDLGILESHVQKLHQASEAGVPKEKMQEGFDILLRLAKSLDQSDDSAYYGLGTPDVHGAGDPKPEVSTVEDVNEAKVAGTQKLAYDVYKANNKTATDILDKMEAVNARIDELVTAGKKFNSKRAKVDIHSVTSKVASIVNDVDLTTPWVADDLQKLSAEADRLHGIFFPGE